MADITNKFPENVSGRYYVAPLCGGLKRGGFAYGVCSASKPPACGGTVAPVNQR